MTEKKTMSLKDFNGFKKAVLKEKQVKRLLKESGIRRIAWFYFLWYVFYLIVACFCVWASFSEKYSSSTCWVFFAMALYGLFLYGKKASLYAKYMRNLKKEFLYTKGEVTSTDTHSRFAKIILSDGTEIQKKMTGYEKCLEGDRVLIYRLDGLKNKDREYYLTTMKL